MCGHVGMAGDILKEDRLFFKNLLVVSTLRGMDSSGIAAVNEKGDINIFKRAIPAQDLILDRRFDTCQEYNTQVLIGHTRAATVGLVNNATAHPFDTGRLVGAHNGTLTGWHNLPDSKNYAVDSECLINNICVNGWDVTMPKVGGAWALVVYDSDDHQLQMLRNDQRTLYIGYKDNGSVMYWASELWMMKALAERCGIKLGKKFFQPKENVLYTWKLPDRKFTPQFPNASTRRIEMPEKKIIPATYPPYQGGAGAGKGQNGGSSYTSPPKTFSQQDGNWAWREGNVRYLPRQEKAQHPRYDSVSSANLIGTVVSFTSVDSKVSLTGQLYLEGICNTHPYETVRCYLHKDDIKRYLESDEAIHGKVCAFYMGDRSGTKEQPYIVVAPNSLSFPGIQKSIIAFGPHGSMINLEKFQLLTKDGCGNCGEKLDVNSEIEWFGESPVCENCIDIVKQIGGAPSKGAKS